MILVDTVVLSEPMKSRGDPKVATWLDRQAPQTLYVSTITVAEILFGVAALPPGRRRQGLAEGFEAVLATSFAGRVLAFDIAAARAYATLRAAARAKGFAITPLDAQIAAITLSRGFAVATRDEGPFRAAGVEVVNPWTEGAE